MTTEEKIIDAAINCIEKYGYRNATIRQIAAEADMNSAAISYYFRSKDVLMRLAIEQSAKNGFNMEDFEYAAHLPIKERLFEIFDFFMEKSFQYPRLTNAHIYEIFVNSKYTSPFVPIMNQFFTDLTKDVLKSHQNMDVQKFKMALMQIASSSLLYCATTPRLFEEYTQIHLDHKEERKRYLTYLIDKLINL